MAPKGAMKRPASAAASPGRAAKRAEVEAAEEAGGPPEQLGPVAEALLQSKDFPAGALEMLGACLEGCLGVPKEQRHPFQQEAAGMVGEVLAQTEAGLKAGVDAAEAEVGEASAQRGEREAAELKAAEELSAKEGSTAIAQAAADNAKAALSAARDALNGVEVAKVAGDDERKAAGEKRSRLGSALSELFLPIKEGSAEQAKVQEGVTAILAVGSDFAFNTTVMKAFPFATKKAAGERGKFDAMVMDQIEAEFKRCSQALDDVIANAEPAEKEQAARVEEAAAEFERAKSHQQECAAALSAAKAAQKEAHASARTAAKAIRELEPAGKQAAKELEQATAQLEAFRAGPLAAFRELLESSEAADEAQEEEDEPMAAPADAEQAAPAAEAVAEEAKAE